HLAGDFSSHVLQDDGKELPAVAPGANFLSRAEEEAGAGRLRLHQCGLRKASARAGVASALAEQISIHDLSLPDAGASVGRSRKLKPPFNHCPPPTVSTSPVM